MAGEFDVQGAREAGYSDREIADYLGQRSGFDVTGAVKAGYSYDEIVNHLAPPPAAKPEPPEPKQATIADDFERGLKGTRADLATAAGAVAGARLSDIEAAKAKADRGDYLSPMEREQARQYDEAKANTRRQLAESVGASIINRREAEALPISPEYKAFQDAEGFSNKLKAFWQAPGEILTSMIAEGAAPSVPGLAGAIVGGPAGGAAVSGVQAFAQSYGGKVAELLAKRGVNLNDRDAVVAALSDPKVSEEIRHEAALSAVPQALAAGASIAVAPVVMAPAKLAGRPVAQQAVNIPAQAAAQGALAAAGEAGSQAIVGEPLEGGRILAAGIGGASQGPVDAAMFTATHGAGAAFRVREETAARRILDAPSTDDAIAAAQQAIDSRPVDVAADAANLREFGNEQDRRQANLIEFFGGLNEGTVEAGPDGAYYYRQGDKVSPLKAWNPDAPPIEGASTISPELARLQQDHYRKLGLDVVYFEDNRSIPFDGAVDPNKPNTLFLSNDPTRNAAQIAAHELTHVLESTTLPDGTNLGDVLHQQIRAGMTDEGWAHARDMFLQTAPKREAFPAGAEGDARHADAVTAHLIREIGADIGGEAPKFQTFLPRVVDEIQSRYGIDVAKDIVRKLISGIQQTMRTLREFFSKPEEMAEYGQPQTVSQNWVSNLDEIHGTLAKMYAERFGTQAEKESAALAAVRDRALRERAIREGFGTFDERARAAEERPAEASTEGPRPEAPPERPAETRQPAEAFPERLTPEAQRPAVDEIHGRIATLRRWLGELDQERRAAAPDSPQMRLLKEQEAVILAKVRGVEDRLTNAARERLANIRGQIEELANPTTDSADMARVREALALEQQRLAQAAAVGEGGPMGGTSRRRPPVRAAEPIRGRAVMPEPRQPAANIPEPIVAAPPGTETPQAAPVAPERLAPVSVPPAEMTLSDHAQAVRAERERLWDEEMRAYKRGLPKNERMVTEAARETVMRREAGDLIRQAIEEHGLPDEYMREVARHYSRKNGESVEDAFYRAADRWFEQAELEAARTYNVGEDVLNYDLLNAPLGRPDADTRSIQEMLRAVDEATHGGTIDHDAIPFESSAVEQPGAREPDAGQRAGAAEDRRAEGAGAGQEARGGSPDALGDAGAARSPREENRQGSLGDSETKFSPRISGSGRRLDTEPPGPVLLKTREATPEELAARRRAEEKAEAELRMRGRKASAKPQQAAGDLPMFGGSLFEEGQKETKDDRQGTLFSPKIEMSPEERAHTVMDILAPEHPSAPPRSKSVEDIARFLMKRGSAALRKLGIQSGRIDEAGSGREHYLLAKAVAAEVEDALNRSENHAGDWYTRKVREAMAVAGTIHPEINTDPHQAFGFKAALAVTSQNETVPSNVRLAEQVYAHFKKTGRFPTDVVASKQVAMNTNFKKLNKLLDVLGDAGTREFLDREFTRRELEQAGWEIGGENMETKVYGSAILGPKIGQGFYQNLNGNYRPVTMDLWFMRAWGRLTGTLVGKQDISKQIDRFEAALKDARRPVPKSQATLEKMAEQISLQHERDFRKYRAEYDSGERQKSELVYAAERLLAGLNGINETPTSGSQRDWMRSVVNSARRLLASRGIRLSNADLQAVWWYPEKDLYAKLGGRDSADINVSYSEALRDLAAKRGIPDADIEAAVRAVDQRPGSAERNADDGRADRGGGDQNRRADEERPLAADDRERQGVSVPEQEVPGVNRLEVRRDALFSPRQEEKPQRTDWMHLRVTDDGMDGAPTGRVEVAVNPTQRELVSLIRESAHKEVRLSKDTRGNVYAWDANRALHSQVENRIDGFEPDKRAQQLGQFPVARLVDGKIALATDLGRPFANVFEWTRDGGPVFSPRQTETPEFKRWFGGSKVVDPETGDPAVLYHGTAGDFSVFDRRHLGRESGAPSAKQGFFFTSDSGVADSYAQGLRRQYDDSPHSIVRFAQWVSGGRYANFNEALLKLFGMKRGDLYGENIMPVYLSIQNPLVVDFRGDAYRERSFNNIIEEAKITGRDGVIFKNAVDPGYRDTPASENPSDIFFAFRPEQIKSATGNRGTFDASNPDIRYSPRESAPPFFSGLTRAVEGLKMTKASPGQWAGAIKNLPGVKPEERAWTGLDDWLAKQPKSVTKEEVLDYLRANEIQVKEVMKGSANVDAAHMAKVEDWLRNSEGMTPGLMDDYKESLREAQRGEADGIQALEAAGVPDDLMLPFYKQPSTKYANYALPGGENYRELLLTLPAKDAYRDMPQRIADMKEDDLRSLLEFNDRQGEYEKMSLAELRQAVEAQELTDEDVANFVNERGLKTKSSDAYHSSHWDEPNVLAHIRFDDRMVGNQKVLHVAEIQSDWHQQGRKQGYDNEAAFQELIKRRDAAPDDSPLQDELQRQIDDMAARGGKGVPDAPFKTTWPELAMKRVIRYAAENGYDAVSWDTGKTNAERYDLSKHVSSIDYEKNEDGTYHLSAQQDGQRIVMGDTIPSDKLSDFVGKEVADRIVQGAGVERKGPGGAPYMRISGVDLKVGGEGMVAFYDKQLPIIANKIGKKFGAKVEEGRVPTKAEKPFEEFAKEYRQNWGDIPDAEMRAEYEKYGREQAQDAHTLPITDAMREGVMKGQALFSPRLHGENPTRQYTPEQQRAFEQAGFAREQASLRDRLNEARQDWRKKAVIQTLDAYAGLKDNDPSGYLAARMANSVSGAQRTFYEYGPLKIEGNTYDLKERNGGVNDLVRWLGPEAHDFLRWVAGNRAEQLKAEDRENLMTPETIAALKSLNRGQTSEPFILSNGKETTNREAVYIDALKRYDALNKNALELGVESGLLNRDRIDPLWNNAFYVPFLRKGDETEPFVGARPGSQMVKQYAFKKLKGGTEKLNNDLWQNAVTNWDHMIDAALRNRAARENLTAAEKIGAATEVSAQDYEHTMTKAEKETTTWVMVDGEKKYYQVHDPDVLAALSTLSAPSRRGVLLDIGRFFASMLRYGVTANPWFAARNLVRDTENTIAVSHISANPVRNLSDGFAMVDMKGRLDNLARAFAGREMLPLNLPDEAVRAMAGGALMRLGSGAEGGIPKVDIRNILDTPNKLQAFGRYLADLATATKEVLAAGEDVNRLALYHQQREQKVPHDFAAFSARDLQDFTLHGAAPVVQAITGITPFLNARLQGLYKLGRVASDADQSVAAAVGGKVVKSAALKLATVFGAMTVASLALDAIYKDDEEYQARTDFDRSTYFWFKIGNARFRIPKGFEIAALSSMAADGVEAFFDKRMTGRRLVDNFWANLRQNLQVQAPAAIQPILDIAANERGTGGPIENEHMKSLLPERRYTADSTLVSRGLSSGLNAAARAVGPTGVSAGSPVQFDYLASAYGGWLATTVLGMADIALRSVSKEPVKPAKDFWAQATQGLVSTEPRQSDRYVDMLYRQGKVVEQAYATYRDLVAKGDAAGATQFFKDNKELIAKHGLVGAVMRLESDLGRQIQMISNNPDPRVTAEKKRLQIMQLQEIQRKAARQAMEAGQ